MSEVQVTSEISGNVWKIETAVGAEVAADDTLMILESMKMEIPVVAPCAGVIEAISVAEGASVQEYDVLVIMTTMA